MSLELITTHCSGDLQKALNFSDSDLHGNERELLKEMAFKLVEFERKMMINEVKEVNSDGFAEGWLDSGCVLN